MVKLLDSDRIKIKIIEALKKHKELTYYGLKKETNSSYDTLKPNCLFLQKIGYIDILEKKNPANNKPYYVLKLAKKK